MEPGAGIDQTAEQRALRDAVRGLLARHPAAASDGGPGYDPVLWRRLCQEIGVAGLALPECYGGAGAGPVETHIVAEELGRNLTATPLLGSAVLAGQLLLATGDDAACRRLLPGIADGSVLAAVAWAGPAGHWDPAGAACTATAAGGGWRLDGDAHYVLYGDSADVLLAAARAPDGVALFEVDPGQPGVARTAGVGLDPSLRVASVQLKGVAGQRIGTGAGRPALARARDLACIALSAEQVGAAQQALAETVGYTLTRVQFGRPIGSFQALQHRMADLHVLVESARSLSYAAAAADGADRELRAAAAHAYCAQALTAVAGEMIQLHGAIGVTWEHAAHRYLKRAHATAQLFGRPAEHVARIAAALLD
ncbi:MAG TPA: acyl-CoA dehydrogenase family protein [Streptosporangiaceae bacterium]